MYAIRSYYGPAEDQQVTEPRPQKVHMKKGIFVIFCLILLSFTVLAAPENLDELFNRKARQATAIFV